MFYSDKLLLFVADYERFVGKAYLPTPNDVPTIGFGHTEGVKFGDKIDLETAYSLLGVDLEETNVEVRNSLGSLEVKQHEFDAVVSLVYNIGITAFNKSRARTALLRGDDIEFLVEAFDSKVGFVKQGSTTLLGLVNRRRDEKTMFVSNKYKRTHQ